jgi:dynactin-5
MEQNPQRFMSINEYKVIPQGNLKISKKFFARGADKILLHSMNVVEDDVILRGDLGKISIGNSTIIDSGTVLRPSLNSITPPYEYKMLKIGSNCYIGKNCVICSLTIGNNVYIGEDCILVKKYFLS